MIRIGLITTEFIQGWGGIASYCINLCRALADEDVEFHIISTMQKNGLHTEDPPGVTPFQNVKFEAIYMGGNNSLSNLYFQLALVRQLSHLVKERKLDLLHSAGPLADNLLRVLGQNQVPHILTYHSTLSGQRQAIATSNVKFKELHRSEQLTLLLYPLMRIYESAGLLRTKNVIAVSKAVSHELKDGYQYKGNISVVPNGIDTDLFKPGERKETRRRIIYSGRLVALKGPQVLINAIPQILKEHNDVMFTFVGSGNLGHYRDLLLRTGVPQKNFEFQYLNYTQMPELYHSGDLLVLPSLLESFPMCILEAMACGLPVVASDTGDVSEMVKDGQTGFKVKVGDSLTMAKKINTLLADNSLRERMGREARSLIEQKFSLQNMGKNTLEVYRRVMEQKT